MRSRILIFLSLLYVVGLFLHLGRMYLQHEEPRRAIIALEMNLRHNYVEPTVLGRLYFKKPPLHNIAIALSFKLFGTNEFAARIVSVLSLLIFSAAIYYFASRVLSAEASLFAAFAFATSFVSYFSYGYLAETDMFFSMFVFLSIISIFLFKRHPGVPGGLFALLALLTKGFPALHYFYLSFVVWALLKKRLWDRYFFLNLFTSSTIILLGFGCWLFLISHGNIHRVNYALGFLLMASGGRVMSIEQLGKFIEHLIRFPLSFYLHMLPFAAFSLVLLKRDLRRMFLEQIRRRNDIKELFLFLVAVFIPNFLIYWLLPAGRIRYALPLSGFFAVSLGIVYEVYTMQNANRKVPFRIGEAVFAFIFVLALLGALFDYNFTRMHGYITCLLVALLALYIGKYLASGKIDLPSSVFTTLLGAGVLLKFLFISVYQSYLFSYYTNYRYYAAKIAGILLKNKAEYVMSDGGNLRLFFYLERDLGKPIHPIGSHRGWVISKRRQYMDMVKYKVDTPKGVYFIGVKNGGKSNGKT